MTWRLWASRDEAYVAPRFMAGDLKISIHASGYCQIGPTLRLRQRSSPDDRAALDRWNRKNTAWPFALRVLFHRSELRPGNVAPDETGVLLPPGEFAVMIGFLDIPVPGYLPAPISVVGSVQRATLPPITVLAVPAPPTPGLLDEAVSVLRRPHNVWKMPVNWSPSSFGVVQTDDDESGSPLFVEFAHDDPSDSRRSRSFEEFPGLVARIEDAPVAPPDGVQVCAALVVDGERQSLFVNEHARCEHRFLVDQALEVLAALRSEGPDGGWSRIGADRWITAMVTRAEADRRRGKFLGE